MNPLHVPTLLMALLLGYLLLTLELGVAQRGVRARPELRRWSWGSRAVLAGWAMLVARPWLPEALSIVAGNGLLGLGLTLYYQAIGLLLGGAPPSRHLFWAVGLWWAVLAWMQSWPTADRTVVVSLVFAALLLLGLWRMLRSGQARWRSLRTLVVTTALAIGVLVLRAVHAISAPADFQDLWQTGLGPAYTLAIAFLALLGAGFGFVLAAFEQVAQEMETMASHDGLTGCLNRSTTDALLAHALARSRREGSPLAFALLDLDHFKQVNDEHGHAAGDEALRQFARAAQQRLRHADVIGRTGGEEFGLILPATDATGARRLVEDIRLATMALELRDAAGAPIRITLLAGIAVVTPDESPSPERLYGRADQALYEAKRAGRNQVVCYGDANPRQAVLLT